MGETTEVIRCVYCRKERPRSEMVQAKLYYHTIRPDGKGGHRRVAAESMEWYCADKPCASHNQMAHDG